ncbi:MAG: hypothetical protein JWO08_1942 [Verrucomicrobiaceae bacterium]|nr:hypothetical protein [Verrucomicrobiaceae bacterium]
MDSQRAPQARAFNEARRSPSLEGPIIDAFVLPSAAVRPSIFLHIRRGLVWLAWLGIAGVAGLIMVYPRQSLINVLTFAKLVNESFHEAFDAQPLKSNAKPPGKDTPTGTMAKNGKPVGQGPGGSSTANGPQAKGPGGTSSQTGSRSVVATAETNGPATGEPLTINTPKSGDGQPEKPKFSLNLVIPGGNGGGQQGPAPMPQQQGPGPSAIIINNNGGGGANGQPPEVPVTMTQVGAATGGGGPMTVQQGGGGNQPPPTIVVNGPMGQPPGVMIQGGQNGPMIQRGTAPDGTPLSPEEQEETSSGSSASSSGLHRNTASLMALSADWPRSVALQGTPAVSIIERTSISGRQYAMQTEHYEFQSDAQVGADVVREMARVFEATYELNKLLPLRLHPEPEKGRPRFVARLFSKDRDYFAAGGMQGSAGTYSRDQACILVPISSMGVKMVNGRMQTERTENTETLIHEVTHQMMNTWLPLVPRWYAEGSADYIAMADYVHGRFFLNQMEDRLRRYLKRRGQQGDTFMMLRPAELMTLDAKTWSMALASNAGGASQNYASATLLTYYFYHLDGKGDAAGMLKYLRAIERGAPEAEASATHLLRGRSMAQLESDVTDAFERRGIKVGTIARGRLAKE